MHSISQIFEFISNNWIIVAFLAPMAWALVNIIDVYFVEGIYKDEVDGTIISGLFQMVPWLAIFPLARINISDYINFSFGYSNQNHLQLSVFMHNALLYSFIGGLFFSLVFYFYFRALFQKNDASLVEIFNNLSVIIVPIAAFFIFREKLPFAGYIGMGVTLLGATMLLAGSIIKKRISASLLGNMFLCALFLSLSLIFEDQAYTMLSDTSLGNSGFWAGFFFFSIGVFACAVIFSIIHARNVFPLIKKYLLIFIIAEGVSFSGTLFMQRALDISPSASFVATIETFVPAFVLLYSVIIVGFLYIFRRPDKINQVLPDLYKLQVREFIPKILAIVTMGMGVYIFNL